MKFFSTSALLCSFALGALSQATVPKDLPCPQNDTYVGKEDVPEIAPAGTPAATTKKLHVEEGAVRSLGISSVLRGTVAYFYWNFEFKTPKGLNVIKVQGDPKHGHFTPWCFDNDRTVVDAQRHSVTVSFAQEPSKPREQSLDSFVRVWLSDREPVTIRQEISATKGKIQVDGKSFNYELKKIEGSDADRDEYKLHLNSKDPLVINHVRLYAPMHRRSTGWSAMEEGLYSDHTYEFPIMLKGALLEFSYYPGTYAELTLPIKATLKAAPASDKTK